MAEPEPTLRDVLTELRALTANVADLTANVADLRADHGEKLDGLSDQLQDVARAVRELGGDVIDHPSEATG